MDDGTELDGTPRTADQVRRLPLGDDFDRGDTCKVAPISVVVPCFRCIDTIAAAVASVAAQTLRPAEIILVDDFSGDGTLEAMQALANSYPAGWIKVFAMARNGGPSGARNRGWEHATQFYIAFLDADDTWHPQKLKLQMGALAADPEIALLAHKMNVQPRMTPAPMLRHPLKLSVIPERVLLFQNPFPTSSVVLRRDLPFRFDENRWRAEDMHLWAQILLCGHRCVKINQVLASWHKPAFGSGGLSGDLRAMRAAGVDVRRALRAQGLLSSRQMYAAHAITLVLYARRCVITTGRQWIRAFHASRPG